VCSSNPSLLLSRRRVVAPVADRLRMWFSAVACVTNHHLSPHRKNARAGKLCVDLPNQQDHLARDVRPRLFQHLQLGDMDLLSSSFALKVRSVLFVFEAVVLD
jgi:hypothetical protein